MLGLGRWFRDLWHKPAVPARIGLARAARPMAQSVGQAEFDVVLAALRQRPDGGAGRLRVISLADFRHAVGDKWPRLTDKVTMIAEQLIRRQIGSGNLFRRVDEETWLLLFPRVSPDQARHIAVAIAQEISRHLLGERCVGGERPLAVAAHLAVADAIDESGRVLTMAVRQAVEQSRALFDHLSPCAPAALQARVASLEGVKQRHRGVAQWTPILMEHAEDQPEEPWQAVGPMPADAHLSLLWRPTWVAEREAIAAYCARVARTDHPGDPPLEGPMAYPVKDEVTAFILDRFVAAVGMRDLLRANSRGSVIIVPLTWECLAGEHRAEVVAPFADVAADIRQRRVQVEICRIPDSADVESINRVVTALRSLCGGVLLRLRLSSPLLCRVDELGEAKIGLDLSELRPHERMNDDRLMSILEMLQGSANDAGLGCYVWSARRRRVVGGVVCGGFQMVNGPGLMKDVGRPALVMPAPRERFLG
jgi:GGDEF domain-containing protein